MQNDYIQSYDGTSTVKNQSTFLISKQSITSRLFPKVARATHKHASILAKVKNKFKRDMSRASCENSPRLKS